MSGLNFELECSCDYCGHEEVVKVVEVDYDAWTNGEPIQDVMDYLTPNQREIILNNCCGACFDEFFPIP